MKEEFLHFLWKYGLYDKEKLLDSEGNRINIINPGEYNRDAGPDFFNARISVAGTVWAGNIEIHLRSSHFDMHGHQNDPGFDNVILHVVAENDRRVFNSRGEELLTSEMNFDSLLHDKYISLVNNPYIIACQDYIKNFDSMLFRNWIEALVIERLKQKSEMIQGILTETDNDWEETFYRLLSRYFGFRVNAEPFEMLARAIPFRIIRKHTDNRFQIEAMLYGTSGMLHEGLFREALADNYYKDLIREFRVLASKYALQPLDGWIWKFARLRPSNFPTVRISQLAGMLAVTGGLFSRVLDIADIRQLKELFEITASSYWDDHYIFGQVKRGNAKRTGTQATDIILINSVLPLLFTYGRSRGLPGYSERALAFLEQIRAEENSVTREWSCIGIKAESALVSQALLQLRDNYCRKRRCLDCRIGFNLISRGVKLKEQNELLLEP
ncbi:MAG TPA: DUF2851 family protein [Bacteroidales bacterium]|nr:DUF2851 family protein [Bacteroidales bacterium]